MSNPEGVVQPPESNPEGLVQPPESNSEGVVRPPGHREEEVFLWKIRRSSNKYREIRVIDWT